MEEHDADCPRYPADLEAVKPTLPAEIEQLVERLGARDRDFGRRRDEMPALNNPDGLAAITTITAQARQIEAMRAAGSALVQALERTTARVYFADDVREIIEAFAAALKDLP